MIKDRYYSLHAEIRQWMSQWQPLAERDPLLVYSMRKVGSTTLTSTLRSQELHVYKQHCLDPVLNARFRGLLSRTGCARQHWIDDGRRFRHRLDLWRTRKAGGNEPGRLKIFTFVKDPLAIALSDFFMQLFEFMPGVVSARSLHSIERLMAYFHETLTVSTKGEGGDHVTRYLAQICAMPSLWFDQEFRPTTGVDVLATPFPVEQGFATYAGEDSDIVLLRTDALSRVGLNAITILTGLKPVSLIQQNVRDKAANGALYKELVARVRLPLALVERYYAIPWLTHFFTPTEIEAFKRRWVDGP